MTTAKPHISRLLLIFCLPILLGACSKKESRVKPKALNLILLCDLSDRITKPGVRENDILISEFVFRVFSDQVKQNLTINSSDKFKFRVLPQKSNNFNTDSFENLLSLDMGRTKITDKNRILCEKQAVLNKNLKALYKNAWKGQICSRYSGSDIWKYFNESLNDDLENNYDNKVIVLTDGYFDFENDKHAQKQGKLHTSSTFYAALKGISWKEKAEKENWGLIPLRFTKNFRCIPCGINPKNEQLTELDKLMYFWIKWMKMSGIDTCFPISYASSDKMLDLINKHLNY
jgi:hypothetical protein